jgi:hypothetical protein
MKRRSLRIPDVGLGRRGFLANALAGGLAVVVTRARRGRGDTGGAAGTTDRASGRGRSRGPGQGQTRPADPWAPLREEVISPDALGPSGDDLAG